MLKVINYSDDLVNLAYSKSIFLAGPTPRDKSIVSWRTEALKWLKDNKYNGVVFVPEPKEGDEFPKDYEKVVEWENKALNMADCILFWVPRDLETLPGFTTNVEYGEWFKSGKVVLGHPKDAPKTEYLDYKAKINNIQVFYSLEESIEGALKFIGEGSKRVKGETAVPLYIWNTDSFQNWYSELKKAGNRLDDAKVEWVFRVGKNKEIVFFWILHVDVYITKEKRHKTNEVVISRSDMSTVLLYKRDYSNASSFFNGSNLLDTEIVLVKEFRSPVRNKEGYVYELPGGSSFDKEKGSELAKKEIKEETGLSIYNFDKRVKVHLPRQVASTMSSHKVYLYSVELTEEEMNIVKNKEGQVFGVEGDTERTYVEVRKLKDLTVFDGIDWSMMGMIFEALTEVEIIENSRF